jgi:hypothetical protein
MLFVEWYLTRLRFEWASDHQRFEDRANLYLIRPVARGEGKSQTGVLREFRAVGRLSMDRSRAVDATGLTQVATSTFSARRMCRHSRQPSPKRHGLKWLTVLAVERQLILAILAQ